MTIRSTPNGPELEVGKRGWCEVRPEERSKSKGDVRLAPVSLSKGPEENLCIMEENLCIMEEKMAYLLLVTMPALFRIGLEAGFCDGVGMRYEDILPIEVDE